MKGKRSLGSPKHRWEDNIRRDLKEIGVNMRNWIGLAQDRDCWRALVYAALNLGCISLRVNLVQRIFNKRCIRFQNWRKDYY